MSRITTHTIEDAPEVSRPLLETVLAVSPTGQLLNLHAQMAHSPAVLVAYTSLRRATADYGTLGPQLGAALMLTAASATGNEYVNAITTLLAQRLGWTQQQIAALRAGTATGDAKVDALTSVVREASIGCGVVTDAAWTTACGAGWTDEQLAEAFAYIGLTVFTAYFCNYARTELDIPAERHAAV
jgi:alkylhydroperoxidase family enzyme